MWLNNSILIKSYLGDQDSNVYKTIKSTKYGSYITKIDCSNHINRNFINKIENWKKIKLIKYQKEFVINDGEENLFLYLVYLLGKNLLILSILKNILKIPFNI